MLIGQKKRRKKENTHVQSISSYFGAITNFIWFLVFLFFPSKQKGNGFFFLAETSVYVNECL